VLGLLQAQEKEGNNNKKGKKKQVGCYSALSSWMMTFLGGLPLLHLASSPFFLNSKRQEEKKKIDTQLTALLVESRQPTLDGNVQLLLEECSFFTHTENKSRGDFLSFPPSQ
jgi:hypothetical protein